MKKISSLILLLWVMVLSWCGGSMNVVEYNDSFVDLVKECTDSTQALFEVFKADGSTLDSISESLQESIALCQNAQSKAAQIWDYKKDSSLKDAVVSLLGMEIEYLQKFWNTSHYWNINNISDEDKDAYDWIVSDLNQSQNELNQQFTNLQDVQEAFAAKYWLKLE